MLDTYIPLLLCAVPTFCVVKKDTCALRPLGFRVGWVGGGLGVEGLGWETWPGFEGGRL